MCKIIRRRRKSFFGFRFGGDKYEGLKHAQIYIEGNLQIVDGILFVINKCTCDGEPEFEVATKIFNLSRSYSYVRVVDDNRTKQ